MLKLKKLVMILFLGVALSAHGQQEPHFAHYWAMEPSYNPAAAGKERVLNVAGAYNMTLTGFENAPKTMYIGADMPVFLLNHFHGLGIQLMNDQIGLFNHQRLVLQYNFKLNVLGGELSIGVQPGLLSEKFNGSKLDLEEAEDPTFTKTDVTNVVVDLAAGVYYKHRNWYAGVSALHLLAPEVELGDRSILKVARAYYLTGGYNIKLKNPFITIHPSVFGTYDGSSYRADVTARVKYTHEKKMLYIGAAYSPKNSVTALVGGNFHGITLGYAYEFYTSVLKIGNGGHELFVGYQTTLNFEKKGRNRHQSVRIL